jgi:hypothetical protein
MAIAANASVNRSDRCMFGAYSPRPHPAPK